MSFCPNCGTKCVDGAAFCSNCGTSLSTTPAWQQTAPVAEPAPVVESPVVEAAPVVEAPVVEAPVWEQPVAPVVEAPVYQQPVYQPPVQPVYQQPVYQQPVYQQPVYQPTPVAAPAAPAAQMPVASRVMGIIALVMGIMGLTLSFVYGFGLIFGIAGIILGNIANNKAAEVNLTNGMANTGKKLGIAGTIVSGVFFLLFVIILVGIGEAASYGSSYYYY